MKLHTHRLPTRSQNVTRVVLGGIMTFAGVSHLTTAREEFQAQVPEWVPVDDDLVVLGSGVVEIALGLSLLALPRHRRLTGLALAAFFVAIFPGNTYVFQLDVSGQTHYGKIRVQGDGVDGEGNHLVVFDWAYQLLPGEPSLDVRPLGR